MTTPEPPDPSVLMNAAAQGDRGAADALMPLVFEQLRRAAQQLMASERPGHTMSATALVHEAYLKLAGPREVPWAGRGHFYSAAAQAMRRILIDHARARGARKAREAGAVRFRDFASLAEQDPEHILAVDDALSRLEDDDPQAAAIVKLRFFAGLSVEQAAEAAGVSPRTAARLWSLARAKLHGFLTETDKDQLHA